MKQFTTEQIDLLNEFNDIIKISQNIAFFTREIEIQIEEYQKLDCYLKELNSRREKLILENKEFDANLILCLEISVQTIQKELSMLINLKKGNMAEAWDNLVDAQIFAGNVIRNHPIDGDALYGYIHKLDVYEKVIFPPMMFSSVGGIVKKSECSICGTDYDQCDHIKGKFYMGKMCCRIISEMDLEEVSIVENPANKRCRMLTIQDSDGEKIDLLTLKKIDQASENQN